MILRRTQNFTLLEVLIALSLTMIILSILITGYYQAVLASTFWQRQDEEQFQRRFLSHRLTDVFGHLEDKDFFFFTSEGVQGMNLAGTPSLVFSYNNGFSKSRYFSQGVLGRLFVDAKGNLTLLTWPEREAWDDHQLPPFHREVLSENVTSLHFEFFRVKSEEHKEAGWVKENWLKDWKEIPGVIKMTITIKGNQSFTYDFPVPKPLSTIRIAA